jgi:hypothetical protein
VEAPTLRTHAGKFPGNTPVSPTGVLAGERTITLRSDGEVGGRPDRWRLVVPRRVTKSECQRRRVPGVRNRFRRRALASSRASALSRAGSAQDGRGRATCRRRMLTWWRSTRISAALDASERMRSAIQALIWQKIRYTNRNVTDADHAELKRTHITAGRVAEYPASTGFG